MFSGASIAAMTVCGLLCIVIPISAVIIFKRKYKDVRISSFFTGAAVFILFALVLEQLLHMVMLPAVMGNVIAYTLYGTLAAGIFEETGRFVAFKTVMKKRNDPRDAVMFGLGHGGAEAVLVAGISLLSYAVTAAMTNSMGIDAVAALASGGNAETEQLVRSQLEMMAQSSAGSYLFSVIERIIAMTFHTAMSVMVFESAKIKGRAWLYPVCIVFHAVLDIAPALYQQGVIPLPPAYPILALLTAAAVFCAVRSYGRIKADMEKETAA